MCMEPQKTPNSHSNLKKTEEQSWKHHTSGFQTRLQSSSDQNSTALTDTQIN